MNNRHRRTGFTLIELMVVVAIIALLIAILLPSLQAARQHAKATVCSSNLHNVGLAMANYLFTSKGAYPSSYLYPDDADGNWSVKQSESRAFGYMHWSYFLYESGQIGDKAFQCPIYDNGGAPRTNPGLERSNWEAGQIDDTPSNEPNERQDKQASRMAYTANAAIMPRNKFTSTLSGGPRVNVFVKENALRQPGATIMVTEFLNNWKALGVPQGGGILSKAHRPINPFYHVGSGFDEYTAAANAPGFMYGLPGDQEYYGLLPTSEVRDKTNILDQSSGVSQINAIGRHHPNSNAVYAKKYGGTSNFLFCDGHAELMTALDSVSKRYWGTHYYSLTGENRVMNMSRVVSSPNP